MPKDYNFSKKIFLKSLIFFLFNFNLLFSDDCNDSLAINYNSDSNDNDECVYINNINSFVVDEDTIAEIDLNTYITDGQGAFGDDVEFYNNISFSVICDGLTGIVDDGCEINENNELSISLVENFDGQTDFFYISIYYNGEYIKNDGLSISINPINDPPEILTQNSNLQATLGNTFELFIEAEDVDDYSFSFVLVNEPVGMNIVNYTTSAIVSYTPQESDTFNSCNGSECFQFQINVSDNQGLTDTKEYEVLIVDASNQLPAIIFQNENINVNEDSNVLIDFTVTDDDGFNASDLSVIATYSRGNIVDEYHSASGSGSNYTTSFPVRPNWNGTFLVTIIAYDDVSYTTDTIDVNVDSLNDNPYITGYENISLNEGENTDRTIFISDIDTNTFLNESPYNISNMSFEIDSDESSPNILYEIISGGAGNSSARINFSTNNEDWFGQESFTITLDDGVSGSVNQSFPVLVNNINDGPTISNIDNQLIDEDTTLNLLISTQDIDSENLSLSASSDHLSFEFYGDSLEITPSKHYNGDNLNVQVTVSDGVLSASTNFNLSISAVDDSPFTEDINFSMQEDSNVEIELNGALELCTDTILANSDGSITCDCENLESGSCDIEDQDLTYQIIQNPSSGIVEINGSIVTYSPELNFAGIDQFIYEVCDQSNLCSNGNVNLSVSEINDAPVAENKSFEINEDQINYEILLDATDPETGNLDFSITNEPNFGSYILEQNVLFYSPNLNYYGTDDFIFSVSDGFNAIQVTYTIAILPINDTPVLSEIEDVIFNEDDSGSLIIVASDVDDEDLVFTVSEGVNIFSVLGSPLEFGVPLTFTSSENYNGIENFTLTVSDDEGLSISQDFSVTVEPVNDMPIAILSEVTVNEDESIDIELSGTDIDEDELSYIVVTNPSKGIATLNNNIISYQSNSHFNGIDSFEFKVSDGELDSDPALITINISSINDRPRAKKITKNIGEDCSLDIEVNENANLCSDNIIDGITCDCDNELYLFGSCDVESSDLTYEVVSQPQNGTVFFNGSIATYTPNLDYISEDGIPDIFKYKVCDSELCSFDDDSEILIENACIDDSQCPFIEITVGELNDPPVVNCINGDCNNPLLLSNYYIMYEDCISYDYFPSEDTNNLDNCDDLEGISISKLRTFNSEISEICNQDSQNVLWYDKDCIDAPNQSEFDYGIAVDIQNNLINNENKGSWKYKLKGQNSFNNFASDIIGCNYKLLDHEDEIKFFPNNDYYSIDGEFPSFKFYPWDKTEDTNDLDSCVESINNTLREDSCGGGIAYSTESIILEWEVVAVNDTPRMDFITDLIGDTSLNESCDVENDLDCLENLNYTVLINAYDSRDPEDNLYYYISSQTTSNNESQSLFKNISFNSDIFLQDNLVNPNQIFNEEIIADNLLKLDLTNYANGSAKIKIGVNDRENFEEGLSVIDSFLVDIRSVNNRINSYSLIENIYEYNDYDNQYMVTSIDNQYYIKYPPYQYNEVDLNINDINQSNVLSIREHMLLNPYTMNDLYFKWDRTTNEGYYLDFDIDPLLNDIPYELYYRLELIDNNNNVFVLKDSIPDSDFGGLDNAFINVKFSSGPFKTYIDSEIYSTQTSVKAQIDTTGLTTYNWRVVASNYFQDYDVLEDYDIYNTATSSSDNSYLINLHKPSINFDFVLNDIYNNYYDLYLSPIATNFTEISNYYNISFNQNSEIYLNYEGDGIILNEINTVSLLSLLNNENNNLNTQNIYHTNGDFNELGVMSWLVPIKNDVGTIKIFTKNMTYDSIIPNSYNTIGSFSGKFNIDFYSDSEMNILLQENDKENITFNSNYDLLSDVLEIKSNKDNINYDIKISYEINSLIDDNISFAKIINNNIILIPSYTENNKLIAYVKDFDSYVVVNGYSSENQDEMPSQVSVISCYPNPFNPSTIISYSVEAEVNAKLNIYNLNGQEVYKNNNIKSDVGLNQYKWNGTDNNGNYLTSGIYFVMIELGEQILMDKVTLLK